MQFRLSEPSVLGPPALLSRTSWVFENVSDATLFSVRRGPPGLPAVSRFLSNLYQLISLNACHLSATSRCSTVEYSMRRIRRCATRSSWSAWTSTRALCRCSFFLDLHFSSHCRHAGRREGFLGTPPLAPRPAFSPFSLLAHYKTTDSVRGSDRGFTFGRTSGSLPPRVEEHPRAARGRPRPQPEPRSSLGCGCLTTEAPPRLGSSSVMNSLGLPEARIELG